MNIFSSFAGSAQHSNASSFLCCKQSPVAKALLISCIICLSILSFWGKAIIPMRFICGCLALGLLILHPALRSRLLATPAFYAMSIYALSTFTSAFLNNVPLLLAFTAIAWWAVYVAFFTMATVYAEQARWAFVALGVTLIGMLVFYLVLGTEGLGIISQSAFQSAGDRLVGAFQEQGNRLAMLLSVSSFLCLSGGVRACHKKQRYFLWLIAAILAFFLINAATRTWAVLYFTFALGYLVLSNVSWRVVGGVIAAVLILFGGMYVFGASQLQLYLDLLHKPLENESLLSRIPMWQAAWSFFVDNPILGIGPEQFRVAYSHYYDLHLAHLAPTERLFAIAKTTHAHNFFMHLLAEGGIIGAASLFVTLVFSFARGILRGGLQRDCAVVLLLIFVVSMINPSFGREPGTLFIAVMGVAAAFPFTLQPNEIKE